MVHDFLAEVFRVYFDLSEKYCNPFFDMIQRQLFMMRALGSAFMIFKTFLLFLLWRRIVRKLFSDFYDVNYKKVFP